MRITVDLDRCTGHGFCEGLAEDVFEVRADGVAHLLDESPGEDRREIVEEAVALCPTRALSIQEALSGQAQRTADGPGRPPGGNVAGASRTS